MIDFKELVLRGYMLDLGLAVINRHYGFTTISIKATKQLAAQTARQNFREWMSRE